MRKPVLTADVCDHLETLPAVDRVNRETGRIYYTHEFRVLCMRRYRAGERPTCIFREAGLGSEIVGSKKIERCIARWKNDAEDPGVPDNPEMFVYGPGSRGRLGQYERAALERRLRSIEFRLATLEGRCGE